MTDDESSPDADDGAEARTLLVMLMGVGQTAALCSAAQLGLADLVKDEPRTLEELTAATGADRSSLGRLVQALVHLGVLTEPTPGRYAATSRGRLLESDAPGSLRSTAMLLGHDALVRTWPHLTGSVRNGADTFTGLFGTDAYTYARQNPDLLTVFQDAMGDQSRQEALSIRDAYDFTGVERVVDVGGGRGALLAALLSEHPAMTGVLLDVPPVIESAHAVFASGPLRDRCTLVAGDFSVAVPEGGDLYIVKRVLNDRTDAEAAALLAKVRRAIAPNGRLLIAEPDGRSPYGTLYDLMMLAVFGTRLRPEAEMRALLERAGFVLNRIIDTTAVTSLRIYEAIPA
jgi:SAM-dependent methyltransferase